MNYEINAGTFSASIEHLGCATPEYALKFVNGNQIKWIYSNNRTALEDVAAQLAVRYLLDELDQQRETLAQCEKIHSEFGRCLFIKDHKDPTHSWERQ